MNQTTSFEAQRANFPSGSVSDLQASYFVLPGGISRLSEIDFDRAPDATGVVSALDHAKSDTPFWEGGPADNFAARYTGALHVETAGTYTLYLTSDDGSALFLDGAQVIDNDGAHATTTRKVTLDLTAGAHALEVLYFERGGVQTLELDWQGPDTGSVRQTIDGAAFGHTAEPDNAPTELSVAGQSYELLDQAAAKQGTAVHSLNTDGSAVTLTENGWKAMTGSFEVTADTVLTFTFSADVIGEIHGIGFANGDDLAPDTFFKIAGTQDWGMESDAWRYIPGSGEVEISIPVGEHFTGTFDRIVLGMDDDKEIGADSTFANIDIGPAEATELSVAGQSYELRDQAAAKQGTAVHSLNADGSAVTLTENGWKALTGSFEVTADTVLKFTFSADVIGEIHGIGFANGDDLAPDTFFKIAGTQDWGMESDAWRYIPGSGEVEISIPVGEHFTGSFDRVVLGMDDDKEIGADSTFANIEIGPAEPDVPGTPEEPSLNFAFTVDAPSGSGTWQDADGSSDVTPGDVLTYTYTLENDGDMALTDVILSDTTAPGLDANSLSGLTDTDGDGHADDLAANAMAETTRSYIVTADDGGTTFTATTTVGAAEIAPQSVTLSETIQDMVLDEETLPGVIRLDTDETSTVDGGRVTNLVLEGEDITGIRLLDQPEHGHASVNPDNTISLVMTRSDHVGALDLRYELSHADGTTSEHVANLDVVPGAQESGWGTSENHYMLAEDAENRVIVEHGDTHRKVYISPTGLTAEDIAARGGKVSDFGHSEDTALAPDIGFDLWYSINPRGSESSNWLLLERGGSYDPGRLYPRDASGESPLNPLFVGAWGEGEDPEVTDRAMMFQADAKNIVTQDISFTGGITVLDSHENILFDNLDFSGKGLVFQGTGGERHNGVTLRNSSIVDVWRDAPVDPESDFWSAHQNRASGLYASNIDGLLLDGIVVDHNGFAPNFDPNGATSGGHPPSMFSHNLYVQWSTTDVTMRYSTIMQGASFGVQFRGGAYVEDNLFLDNNIPFSVLGGDYKGYGPVGNYSLVNGNLVTSAAARGSDAPHIGALDWGIRNSAFLTTLIDNIVAHANDPDNPDDMVPGRSANHRKHGEDSVFTDDTMIWRWGDKNVNVDGLDPDMLNATTIQRYIADVLGSDAATIKDLAQYLRGLEGEEQAAATEDILNYFRVGFGIKDTPRDEADTLRFVPDVRGDGVRWDNRLNWDSGDLPGTMAGDSVDLGGNQVVFGGTVTLEDMAFGPDGGLILTHGRLDVDGTLTGSAGAMLDIDRAGQVWVNGTTNGTEALAITMNGGRFANTGTFDSPVTLAANDGQTILATGGAEFRVDVHSRIDIGGAARIGFDGDDDGAAILRLKAGATLGFTARDDGLATLGEFRSGAFGEAPDVRSGIDLGDADMELNLTDLEAADSLIFIDVDELVGSFGTLAVQGLGNRDAEIITDYDEDIILLQLTEGTGQTSLSTRGTQDMIDPGYEALWEMLNTDAVAAPDFFAL